MTQKKLSFGDLAGDAVSPHSHPQNNSMLSSGTPGVFTILDDSLMTDCLLNFPEVTTLLQMNHLFLIMTQSPKNRKTTNVFWQHEKPIQHSSPFINSLQRVHKGGVSGNNPMLEFLWIGNPLFAGVI
jgi:hypothetical protein